LFNSNAFEKLKNFVLHTLKFTMFKIFRTKWFRSAPVLATLWLSSTAVILIGVNSYFPDYLFMPMSWRSIWSWTNNYTI